jgi:hypothetical protein
MADSFDAAGTKIDEQKRALLAAMAQAGSAGKAAYEQAQARIAAQRQASLAAALDGANERGLSPELQEQLSSRITAPLDRQAADLSASQASYAGHQATIQAASESYLGEAQAAIPSLRARSERQVAALRAQAEQDEADRQLKRQLAEFGFLRGQTDFENDKVLAELGLKKAELGFEQDLAKGDIDLQKAQLGLQGEELALALARAKASGGGSGGGLTGAGGKQLSDPQLAQRLLGAARAQKAEVNARRPGEHPLSGSYLTRRVHGGGYKSDEELAREIGLTKGVNPNVVHGREELNPKAKSAQKDAAAKAAGLSDKHAADLRKNTRYKQGVEQALAALELGDSYNDFKRFLGSYAPLRDRPTIVNLILAEFKNRFPGSRPAKG